MLNIWAQLLECRNILLGSPGIKQLQQLDSQLKRAYSILPFLRGINIVKAIYDAKSTKLNSVKIIQRTSEQGGTSSTIAALKKKSNFIIRLRWTTVREKLKCCLLTCKSEFITFPFWIAEIPKRLTYKFNSSTTNSWQRSDKPSSVFSAG